VSRDRGDARTAATPLGPGGAAPVVEGRTDEGTPISLADFKGRALAVFLLGRGIDRAARALLRAIAAAAPELLRAEHSPVAVSAEPAAMLAELRDTEALPFLLISDTELGIHRALAGEVRRGPGGAWLVDKDGIVAAVIPPRKDKELIAAVLAALARTQRRPGA
jgi:peroxiredoxin Q/BCP